MRRLVTLFLVIPLLGAAVAPAAGRAPNLNESPTTSVRTDILPGVELTVEEVDPGLYRVLRDGRRSLFRGWELIAGQDGSIWGLRDGGFFRVGGQYHEWPQHIKYIEAFDVARDGTVWVVGAGPTLDDKQTAKKDEPTIRSFDGRSWTFGKRGESLHVVAAPDGTVWATWVGRNGRVLARWGKDGWQRSDTPPPRGAEDVFIASNGDMWARSWSDDGGLSHLVDGTWQPLGPSVADVDVGPDGTIWALRQPEVQVVEGGDPDNWADFVTDDEGNWVYDYEDTLMRFDGSAWQEWGPADGVPAGLVGLRAAPDGSLWATGDGGMFHFEGTTWSHYLAGLCPDVFEVAPDGSLWAVDGAEDTDGVRLADLYVITPEAVAVAE